jgi:hypothetical protein
LPGLSLCKINIKREEQEKNEIEKANKDTRVTRLSAN